VASQRCQDPQDHRRLLRDEHEKADYDFVYTPHIGKAQLWETSEHLGFYKENMYSPIDIEGQNITSNP
jgi:threonyl-tRNA synthetase